MVIEKIIEKSKSLNKKIVLPESTEPRILKAADIATRKKIAKIVLIGSEKEIKKAADKHNIKLKGMEIIDNEKYEKNEELAESLYETRKHKGMTMSKAKKLLKNKIYFATMLVKNNIVDGSLSGAVHPTADTIRPAFQIIGTKEDVNVASGVFLMITKEKGKEKIFLFGDSAVNPNPSSSQLAEIAICSAKTYQKLIGRKPRVAMLSFSTHGSAKHDMVDKVKKATDIVKKKNTELIIDGDVQVDAAIVPEAARIKCPKSRLKGKANVLIFPDLNAGNIGYKIVERLAHAKAVGPILQGLKMPVNDLSRGCNVKDIVNMIAITSVME